jgi:hypothetical protein
VQKGFGHSRLVHTLHATCWRALLEFQEAPRDERKLTIQSVVGGLESHLNKGIGTDTMTGDEILPISLELQRLTVILADQVAQSCLCKSNTRAQLGRKLPLQLLWRGVNTLVRIGTVAWLPTGRLVGLGVLGQFSVEEGGCGWVYRPSEEHETFSEDVGSEPEHCVPIDAGVLKVDPSCPVSTYDDLQLPVIRGQNGLTMVL